MFNGSFALYGNDTELTGAGRLSLRALQSALERRVPRSLFNASAGSYQISNVRYKPRQKLVIGLVSNVGGNPVGIRVFPEAKLESRLEKARDVHPDHTFLLPELNAVAWIFPAERKLSLAVVADTASLRDLLSAERGLLLRAVELVHFVPERSYTARVHARDLDGSSWCEFLKIYDDDAGARTARTMTQLRTQCKTSSIAVPASVSYFAGHRLMLQSALPRDPGAMLSLEQAAGALAEFHRMDLVGVPEFAETSDDEIEAALSLVRAVFPGSIGAVKRTVDRIRRARATTVSTPDCLLHGDAHLGNIFPVAGGRIGIIDLDSVTKGPPEHDLASFFAFKVWLALRERRVTGRLLEAYPRFITAYNRSAPHRVGIDRAWTVLAEKFVTERIARGIARGKLASEAEMTSFLDLAGLSLRAAACGGA